MGRQRVLEPNLFHKDWIERRRNGESLSAIGLVAGVSKQAVSDAIRRFAPELVVEPFRHAQTTIERCRILWEQGLSARKIAEKITSDGVPMSKKAIIGLVARNGFPGRASPIRGPA